jgi:hypothetical protein
MTIVKDKIDLVVSSHPDLQEPIHELASIPLNNNNNKTLGPKNYRRLDSSVSAKLTNVIRSFNVCGMIVGWPLQKEGWCGASCGRVLFALDQLATCDDFRILSTNRPICLFDDQHQTRRHRHLEEDDWGRSQLYYRTTRKTVHFASKEQYENVVHHPPNEIWNAFCETYWPQEVHSSDTSSSDSNDYVTPSDLVISSNQEKPRNPNRIISAAAWMKSYNKNNSVIISTNF